MNVAIYRTCDRPLYTERTFSRLVQSTSSDVRILMMENSGDQSNTQKNRKTFEDYADERCEIRVSGKRLGITKPLLAGVEYFVKNYGTPHHVFNVDDDILVPKPHEGIHWDEVLSAMLDGPWGAAGLFYHVMGRDKDPRDLQDKLDGKGLAAGIEGRFMAGMCAGFRYSIYKKNPMKDVGIASLNLWSEKYARCGWSTNENFLIQEIDKFAPEGESLRYTEYRDYSKHIDEMRARLRSS